MAFCFELFYLFRLSIKTPCHYPPLAIETDSGIIKPPRQHLTKTITEDKAN